MSLWKKKDTVKGKYQALGRIWRISTEVSRATLIFIGTRKVPQYFLQAKQADPKEFVGDATNDRKWEGKGKKIP